MSIHYDCVIVGAGINGTGVARELALRGLKVALFDKSDITSGTSSASSKLVHGGLRYLETGQFSLVYESLRERKRLLKAYPHLVAPLRFLVPIYKGIGWQKWLLRLGLIFYDFLALFSGFEKHRFLSKDEMVFLQPEIRQKNLKGAGLYSDAQMDDARLCVEVAIEARERGADIFTYHKLAKRKLSKNGLYSLEFQDQLSQKNRRVDAKYVVYALGAWTDEVLGTSFLSRSKGVHLLMEGITVKKALLLKAPQDNRAFFVIPWLGRALVGTTDTPFSESCDEVSVREEDVNYLLEALSWYFPESQISKEKIVSSFVGIRPLLNSDQSSVRRSREHKFEQMDAQSFAIIGGKYTTFRLIAEQAARKVCQYLRPNTKFRPLTRNQTLVAPFPNTKRQAYLYQKYGRRWAEVEAVIDSRPAFGQPLAGSEVYVGELVYAHRYEFVKTIEDFVRRRTNLMLNGSVSKSMLIEIAKVFVECLDEDKKRIQEEAAQLVAKLQGE